MTRNRTCPVSRAIVAGLLSSIALSPAAFAQEARGVGESAVPDPNEIVVTALKRTERQVDVPISLTVLSGETIENTRVFDVQNLARITPGFTFEDSLISSGARARIRGIGSPTFTSGVETSVAVIIDGVVTGPSGSGLSNLFDVERVEVLRGPQGTLFGKNASAGAVNVVSRAPTKEFSGYVNASYTLDDFSPQTDFNTLRVDAAVSGSLGPNTTARFAMFSRSDKEGAAFNNFQQTDENRRRQWGGRLSLRHEVGNFEANLIASYIKTDDRCCGPTFREIDPLANGLPNTPLLRNLAAANNIDISDTNRDSMTSGRVGEESEAIHISLTMDYSFGNGGVMRSITGYRKFDSLGTDDSERLAVDLADATFGDIDLRIFSQEFQYVSPDDRPLSYVVGLFFYDQRIDDTFRVGGALGTADPLFRVSTANSLIKVFHAAAFANLTWRVADDWEVQAGLRLLYEDQSMTGIRVGSFFGPNRPFNQVGVSDTDWVGRLSLRYNPNSDTSLFVSANRGYKGFGLNNSNSGPFFAPANNADPILNPETVISIEAGWKQIAFDGRLQTNLVAFWSEFTDFQTSAFDGQSNTFSLRNAGSLEIKGIEFDAVARPWEGGSLIVGAAWIDATFKDFRGAPCTALQSALRQCPAAGQDLSGRRVDGAPEWQLSLIGRQDFNIGSVGAWASAEYSYRGWVNYNSDLDPMLVQPAWDIVNLRAAIRPTENIEVIGFVENLFNEVYALRISPAPLLPGVSSHYLAPGRIFGAELRFRF